MTATPAVRSVPEGASVVEVYGSTFLLEWLDLDVLAAAAALHRRLAGEQPVGTGSGMPRSGTAV
ncbi:MAG TPA: hypothetical protein VGD12_06360 [Blastococcus sp.]|jgi:hypothetical protein